MVSVKVPLLTARTHHEVFIYKVPRAGARVWWVLGCIHKVCGLNNMGSKAHAASHWVQRYFATWQNWFQKAGWPEVLARSAHGMIAKKDDGIPAEALCNSPCLHKGDR